MVSISNVYLYATEGTISTHKKCVASLKSNQTEKTFETSEISLTVFAEYMLDSWISVSKEVWLSFFHKSSQTSDPLSVENIQATALQHLLNPFIIFYKLIFCKISHMFLVVYLPILAILYYSLLLSSILSPWRSHGLFLRSCSPIVYMCI